MSLNNGRLYFLRRLFGLPLVLVTAVTLASVPSPSHANAEPDPVRTWNEVALDTVRTKSLSDARSARLLAMLNVAMYDAVNGIMARRSPMAARAHALVPPDGAPLAGLTHAAASAAAHAVLAGEHPDLAAGYDAQLASDLASLPPHGPAAAGVGWGEYVGQAVRAARANDGSAGNEVQPAGTGPGEFRASWSGVQFRNLVPFGIVDSLAYVPDGPPAPDSVEYAQAWAEVKELGDAALPDQAKLDTYVFWSVGGGTVQPPGTWVQIALLVTEGMNLELPEMTRLLALVSMALADAVAPTVMTKFVYHHWRPRTAIHEANTDGNPLTAPDPTWQPRAGTPGTSPEYFSGHSSFSAAGATALAGFFCNDEIAFTFASDSAPGGLARSYPSFSDAAAECGLSRMLGGIHFSFGNVDGLIAGEGVATEILATRLLRLRGPTHDGGCPR